MKAQWKGFAVIAMVLPFVATGCGANIAPPPSPPAPTPTVEAQEWDYVALGDSVTFGMIRHYAAMLEQDLKVKIKIRDWSVGGEHSSYLLEKLRTNERLRQDLREAEIITFEIPWNVIEVPVRTFESPAQGACGGTDNQDCLRKAFETYMADTDKIMAEIISLRSPSAALIRTQDTYQFQVRESKAAGTFEVINQYWRAANAHVIEVATQYHIPVARVYDAFMGVDGTEDPMDKGLISDGFHATKEGSILMAELFRKLGYKHAPSSP